MSRETSIPLSPVVSRDQWQAARAALLAKEKAALRAADALAAERRRLPRLRIEKDYRFQGPGGEAHLGDLFEGRRQLIVYHFMFAPEAEQGCPGCSMFVDQIGHPAHLHARDVTLVLVSRAPLEKIEAFKRRMGWTLPWYSSYGSDFNEDFRATTTEGEDHRLSVFIRQGREVFLAYDTQDRGVEPLGTVWSFLDIAPLGRQEAWEDSPPGYPQGAPYEWWRHHDRYGAASEEEA